VNNDSEQLLDYGWKLETEDSTSWFVELVVTPCSFCGERSIDGQGVIDLDFELTVKDSKKSEKARFSASAGAFCHTHGLTKFYCGLEDIHLRDVDGTAGFELFDGGVELAISTLDPVHKTALVKIRIHPRLFPWPEVKGATRKTLREMKAEGVLLEETFITGPRSIANAHKQMAKLIRDLKS
jgi:hypothetical protein